MEKWMPYRTERPTVTDLRSTPLPDDEEGVVVPCKT